MKTKLLFLALFLLNLSIYAQKKPESSIKLDSKITDINLHNTTGIAVVTTNGGVYGIDGDGKKIWGFNEPGFIKGLNVLGQEVGSSFIEIPFSTFGQFNQTVFDIKNGKKIIDEKINEYESIIYNKLVTGKKAILFLAKTNDKKAKLFLVNIEDSNIIWESAIESNKKLSSLFSANADMNNFIQNDDRIAFSAGKTIFVINKHNGDVILSKKYEAGKLFFSEDQSLLIAVEDDGGSIIGSTIKAGLTMGLSLLGDKPIGKELVAFDVNTGKEAWKKPIKLDEGFINYQFADKKLIAIHKDGASLYDYHTGKKLWKKEFKEKRVKSIEKTDEGYMVYYKNKKHLVDNSGKKIWKKPEKVIKNVDFEVDDDENFTVFNYNKGSVFITPFRIEYFEKGKEKRVYKIKLDDETDKLAYDDKNKNIILLSNKNLYIINPDKDLGKETVKKIDFKENEKINSIEIRENGYFINSNWEYAITDFNGNLIKKEYYAQPGEGLRYLKNIGASIASIAATEITVTSSDNQKSMYNSKGFVNKENTQKIHLSKNHQEYQDLSDYLYTPERYNAFKATKNSAFFYTKRNDKKVLLQVSKDTGDVINTFEFGVNNPIYIVDKTINKIYFTKGDEVKIYSFK